MGCNPMWIVESPSGAFFEVKPPGTTVIIVNGGEYRGFNSYVFHNLLKMKVIVTIFSLLEQQNR